jgi:hypothetical protein
MVYRVVQTILVYPDKTPRLVKTDLKEIGLKVRNCNSKS